MWAYCATCSLCAADIHIGANNHKELMEEVKAAAVHLEAMKEVRAISEAAGGWGRDGSQGLVGKAGGVGRGCLRGWEGFNSKVRGTRASNGRDAAGQGLWETVSINIGWRGRCNTIGALQRCGSHQGKLQVVEGVHYQGGEEDDYCAAGLGMLGRRQR